MISEYLYKKEDKKEYNETFLNGLLGETTAKELMNAMSSEGWKAVKDLSGDKLTDMVNSGMDTGVPTMMIGPSAIGKTSRVKKAVRDRSPLYRNQLSSTR